MFKEMSMFVVMLFSVPVLGQPLEFSDDFQSAATYDSTSLLACLYGGPLSKYTAINAVTGDIFNTRAVSGGGRLVLSARDAGLLPGLDTHSELVAIGHFGVGLGCPGEPAFQTSNMPFTSPNLCTYGGVSYNEWQTDSVRNTYGTDGQPGVGGVDDDNDGTTDEANESPNLRPTTVNGGYGSFADGTGYLVGQDNAPGVAGVDDDGNGVTDDHGETGWNFTDDGDDHSHYVEWIAFKGNIATSSSMLVVFDKAWNDSGFSLYELYNLAYIELEKTNEILAGFYNANTHYNYAICASGTCYGAQLWIENNMANPRETLGPAINSHHTTPVDNASSLAAAHWNNALTGGFIRQITYRGNQNFSDTFWVISGNPQQFYPSVSADLDNDRDVDASDFLTLSNCFNGSLNPPAGVCSNLQSDLDGDNDVDASDFLTFSNCFNGSLNRPKSLCFPPNLTACP